MCLRDREKLERTGQYLGDTKGVSALGKKIIGLVLQAAPEALKKSSASQLV